MSASGAGGCRFDPEPCHSKGVKNGTSGYRKTPKFSNARKLSCNTPKIQIKGPNLRAFLQKDSNGIANSEDPDQTAPPGAV